MFHNSPTAEKWKDTGSTKLSAYPQSSTMAELIPSVRRDIRWLGANKTEGTYKETKSKVDRREKKEAKIEQSTDAFPGWHFKSKTWTTVPWIIPVLIQWTKHTHQDSKFCVLLLCGAHQVLQQWWMLEWACEKSKCWLQNSGQVSCYWKKLKGAEVQLLEKL